jgi:hypothetical protein
MDRSQSPVRELRPLRFFRIVHRNPASREDFLSNRDRGLPPRGPEIDDPAEWAGISVFDTLERARRLALRRNLALGAFIAELHVAEDAPVIARKTFGPGHYTLWGTPETFVDLVVDIHPIGA